MSLLRENMEESIKATLRTYNLKSEDYDDESFLLSDIVHDILCDIRNNLKSIDIGELL
jgi:hypothetical protein